MGKRAKGSLSEKAYNTLKNALCDCTFSDGDLLSENQLAKQLNMSRTPVREALKSLESEGWIEIKNGVGIYVKPLSSKDIVDLYEIRSLLEVKAAETAIHYITDEEIDRFEREFLAILDADDDVVGSRLSEFSRIDWELHDLIIHRCQNRYIKETLISNVANIKRYQTLSIEAVNDLRESTHQHLDILAAMRTRNAKLLCNTLRTHLDWAMSFLSIQ